MQKPVYMEEKSVRIAKNLEKKKIFFTYNQWESTSPSIENTLQRVSFTCYFITWDHVAVFSSRSFS